MNFRFQNLLGAPYRGGPAIISGSNILISPVGNRISVTDLVKSETITLPCQASANISRLAVSPDGNFLLAVDENSRSLFINLRRHVVLHRLSFKKPVSAVRFSPNGSYIAVGVGKLVQIWRSPGFRKEFFPFELVRTFSDCNDKVTAIDWSPDSNYLFVGSKDLTVRLFYLKKVKGINNRPFLFLGHRDSIVGVFVGIDKTTNQVSRVYTISRDCSIFTWTCSAIEGKNNELDAEVSEPLSPGTPEQRPSADFEGNSEIDLNVKKRKNFDEGESILGKESESNLHNWKWKLLKKDFFMQSPAKLTACGYHQGLDLVVVGFSNGVFGLYQMPDFFCIHLLSISREKITTAVFNELGNWLTFGCAKLGQLLVWEWRSESYILKQQGHYFDVNCVAYSPDSQLLATGADDNKIKVNDEFMNEYLHYELCFLCCSLAYINR